MKTRLFYKVVCSVVITLCSTCLAQADEATQSLKKKLSVLQSYQANFTQTITDGFGQRLQRLEGELLLAKPSKMRWHVTIPDESLIIADGAGVWNIDYFAEQITVFDQSEVTRDNPLMILISDDVDSWKNFTVSKDNDDFILTAVNEDSAIKVVKITFDNNLLRQLTTIDAQQQASLYLFSDIKQNKQIDKKLFTYTNTDNFIVDDQR